MNDKTITNVPDAAGAVPGSEGQERTPAPTSASTSKDFSGTTLGSYQLVRKIAEGGMGVVYEAIQTNLSRKVALKILSEELASLDEYVQRFQREAKAAAALNHPNVVQVHDFGKSGGWCYLIMEYVDGQDLSDYIDEHGKISILAALDIIEQSAQALKAAGEKSIIHRDIKPSNLLLTRDGRVKISDLGLAKILTEASDLTLSGIGMGSPYFMAPEQANDARDVDHRADIYALGLTLLFLLTGKRPFDGNTPFSIVLAHANKPLPRGIELGTDLPAEVEGLIQRMSAKEPKARYANYDLLIDDLRRVKAGYAPAFELPKPKSRFPQRNMAMAAAVIVSALLAVAAFFLGRTRKETSQNSTPPAHITQRSDIRPEREPADRFRDGPLDGPHQEREFEDQRNPEGGGGLPLPMSLLPRPSFSPLADGPLESMLSQADDYAAKNPQNFKDMIDRYRQVMSKARGTPQESEIDRKMQSVISRHQEALRQAIRAYETKMNEKIRAGNPQAAYDVWRDFPTNLRTRQSDLQVQQMLQRSLPPGFVPR